MRTERAPHTPVLVREVLQGLVGRSDGSYLDGTVGAGGHAEALLKKLSEGGRLLGMDRDEEALKVAGKRLGVFESSCRLVQGSYDDLEKACRAMGVEKWDGVLLDLGVSSMQLDEEERGFSFSKEASLDMRMDRGAPMTAADLVNQSSQRELERILREFGEEPFAPRVARALVEARRQKRIETTSELAEIASRSLPSFRRRQRVHAATLTFQALRIAVNQELDRLQNFLQKIPGYLTPGGRVAVLSYHSLEDRLVKRSFVHWEKEGVLKRLTKKPLVATDEEISGNPRARSAKLRIAERGV